MAVELELRHEDDRQIRFAYPWGWSIVTIPAGAALFFAAANAALPTRITLIAAGVVLIIIGLRAMLWRDEFLLDFATHTYSRRTGRWPNAATVSGPFSELEKLVLRFDVRSGGRGKTLPRWNLELQFRDASRNLTLAQFSSEAKAYAKLDLWSRRLGIPKSDETRPANSAAAQSFPARTAAVPSGGIPALPGNTRILLQQDGQSRRILLPAGGVTAGALIFACVPAVLFYMGLSSMHSNQPNAAQSQIVALVIVGLAVLLTAALCIGIFAHETIVDRGHEISVGKRALGIDYNTRVLPKNEIEDVGIRQRPRSAAADRQRRTPSPAFELYIRSRSQMLSLGANISQQDREWLREALTGLTART
jgi:cytochrome c biogenesis protein CcdA